MSKACDESVMKSSRFAIPSIVVDDRSRRLVTVLLNTIEMLMSITRRPLTHAGRYAESRGEFHLTP